MYVIVLIFFAKLPRIVLRSISQLNGKPKAAWNLVLVYIFLILWYFVEMRNFFQQRFSFLLHSLVIIFIMPWNQSKIAKGVGGWIEVEIIINNVRRPRKRHAFRVYVENFSIFFSRTLSKDSGCFLMPPQLILQSSQPIYTFLMEIYSACTFFVSIFSIHDSHPLNIWGRKKPPRLGKFFNPHTYTHRKFSLFFPSPSSSCMEAASPLGNSEFECLFYSWEPTICGQKFYRLRKNSIRLHLIKN